MTVAWVITQEGTRHSTEVIGILSSRKSAKDIKAYLEWFYALLHHSPSEHLNFARYTNPEVPCKAECWKTNTGIPETSLMRCGYNPYLVARRAKNVSLIIDASVLKWTDPDRLVCDAQTPPNIVKKIPGVKREAPIHLPLRIMSEDKALTAGCGGAEKADTPPPFSLEKVVLASMRREDEMKNKGKVKVRPKTVRG